MVILIGGEKGGTGKTTIATNLAGCLALKHQAVLLLDADSQISATFWAMTRDDSEIAPRIPCLKKSGGQIHREVELLKKKFENIIIDAGGRDSMELRSSMIIADKFFIPIRPSQFDVWTIEKLDRMIGEVQLLNPGLQSYAFLNLASTHPKVNEIPEAQEYLKDFSNIRLADTVIRDRIAFRNAGKNGMCVLELDDKRAKTEIETLYTEVFG